jgi:hypothetical protein
MLGHGGVLPDHGSCDAALCLPYMPSSHPGGLLMVGGAACWGPHCDVREIMGGVVPWLLERSAGLGTPGSSGGSQSSAACLSRGPTLPQS